jgi:hypothetical protein
MILPDINLEGAMKSMTIGTENVTDGLLEVM